LLSPALSQIYDAGAAVVVFAIHYRLRVTDDAAAEGGSVDAPAPADETAHEDD